MVIGERDLQLGQGLNEARLGWSLIHALRGGLERRCACVLDQAFWVDHLRASLISIPLSM